MLSFGFFILKDLNLSCAFWIYLLFCRLIVELEVSLIFNNCKNTPAFVEMCMVQVTIGSQCEADNI